MMQPSRDLTAQLPEEALQGSGKHLVQLPHLHRLLEWRPEVMIATAIVMISATILALPVALVYRRLRAKRGIDSSVLQSILILPAAVAGIVSVVRGSLALAFSLAGVVTAVRFRNSLKDTHDAVYIFFAVALGLAAGDQVLDMGVALSVVFCGTMLLLHWTRLDVVPSQQSGSGSAAAEERGQEDAVPNDVAHDVSRQTQMVSVYTQHPSSARHLVEELLPNVAKEWHLAEIVPGGDGRSTLEYVVRFKKKVAPDAAVEEINLAGKSEGISAQINTQRVGT
ncbi:MAG TPA: DUF4956 domain-containing protein [Gemmatimonadaceae bacterium]|nr:DUF4956 domain-containing protein [Gemmatimonadaceae bacterium]